MKRAAAVLLVALALAGCAPSSGEQERALEMAWAMTPPDERAEVCWAFEARPDVFLDTFVSSDQEPRLDREMVERFYEGVCGADA